MRIRVAREDDIDVLAALLEQLFSIEEDFSIEREKQRSGLSLLMKSESGVILVAEGQSGIIGMVTGQLVVSTAEGGWSLLVEDMIVDSDNRGKGIGKNLLKALTDWAKKRGVLRMQLLADSDNQPAFDFYYRNDWNRTNLICLRKYPKL